MLIETYFLINKKGTTTPFWCVLPEEKLCLRSHGKIMFRGL
jgi:hypothetical protein